MARVQIPVGAFLGRTDVRSEIAGGFEPYESQRPNRVRATVSFRFTSPVGAFLEGTESNQKKDYRPSLWLSCDLMKRLSAC